MSQLERPESVQKVMKWLAYGIALKARMIDQRVLSFTEPCPFCEGGHIQALLAGPKHHLAAACSTDGCIRMRE